jgi:hypothetical protein
VSHVDVRKAVVLGCHHQGALEFLMYCCIGRKKERLVFLGRVVEKSE